MNLVTSDANSGGRVERGLGLPCQYHVLIDLACKSVQCCDLKLTCALADRSSTLGWLSSSNTKVSLEQLCTPLAPAALCLMLDLLQDHSLICSI